MQRICLVVQRYGKEIVGGSEQLARCYGQLLKKNYDVHVATTCATDYMTWRNTFPSGIKQDEGVWIHRFQTDFERSEYWHRLHRLLLLRHIVYSSIDDGNLPVEQWPILWSEAHRKDALREAVEKLPTAVQEEFVRQQGPYSSPLLSFLETEANNFDFFLFFTYLYPTTYFGFPRVPREKRILIPTLHDEPPAYLPVFKDMIRQFSRIAFLSPGEKSFARRLCNANIPEELVGMPVEISSGDPPRIKVPDAPYFLYCGRVDSAKGTNTLFEYFLRYKSECPSDLKLIVTGHAVDPIPDSPDIRFLGFVSEADKFALMANATSFVQPSPFESFSIVLLEAFLAGAPALVNGNSEVLAEHCRAANAGLEYRNYAEFAECASFLLENAAIRKHLGENGKRYVEENYSSAIVGQRLKGILHDDLIPKQKGASGLSLNTSAESRSDPQPSNNGGKSAPAIVTSLRIRNIREDLSFRSADLDGRTVADLREYLSESIVSPEARTELLGYIQEALGRFIRTMCLVPEKTGSLLELGANPYFLTLLLKKFRNYDLHLANYFSERHPYDIEKIYEQRIVNTRHGEEHVFTYRMFNIEKDRFPYRDDSFDVVLFCEIVEHLTSDPVAAFGEIHRILKPAGALVLTTPNVARRENIHRLANNENIYDAYSRYGIYGRHNREYTTAELAQLLTALGFSIEQVCTHDVHPDAAIVKKSSLTVEETGSQGQYIFLRASKSGTFSPSHPSWLYR
jgi:glycosyltransferase involved in cell wall biosynthesis/SAM-dependent methyltransferase